MNRIPVSFLGANTPRGFVSLFSELYNPYEKSRCYIIKGGPGTGKSTLMKKIARRGENMGLVTERVYCSADPDSLDAVIFPEIKVSVADGTAPHVIEPRFPGVCESIINTGDLWDSRKLFSRGDEIRRLTTENSLYHRRSTGYLSAAGSLNDEAVAFTDSFIDKNKLYGFALRFAHRELPDKKKGVPGKRTKRFISGITPEGCIFLDDAFKGVSRLIALEDEYTAAAGLLAERTGEIAIKNGYDVIFCHCPMKPSLECEHIIIPEASLALVSVKTAHSCGLEFDKIIHASRFFSHREGFPTAYLRLTRAMVRDLTQKACLQLKNAKSTHDALEELYSSAMDFSALEEMGNDLADEIFSLV